MFFRPFWFPFKFKFVCFLSIFYFCPFLMCYFYFMSTSCSFFADLFGPLLGHFKFMRTSFSHYQWGQSLSFNFQMITIVFSTSGGYRIFFSFLDAAAHRIFRYWRWKGTPRVFCYRRVTKRVDSTQMDRSHFQLWQQGALDPQGGSAPAPPAIWAAAKTKKGSNSKIFMTYGRSH